MTILRTRPAEVDIKRSLAMLRARATTKTLQGMARYGIPNDKAWGVSVADLHTIAKQLGKSHALAAALWKTDVYEARMLACFVDDPALVTAAQMDRWCKQFDNWAVCDTACFHLFDRTPHAYARVKAWAPKESEFVRRAAFALIASLAGHDKTSDDAAFAPFLPIIERGARDERNFVKKGVSWALRSVGRRSPALHEQSLALATKLAADDDAAARWVGKDAVRDLAKVKVKPRATTKPKTKAKPATR